MKTIFKTFVILTVLSLIWLCLSCGSRKVNKEHSKEEIKTEVVDNSVIEKQSESNIKQTTTLKVDDKNEIISKEDTFEPIDPTKEASIIDENGKKTILNNSKKTSKSTTQKNNTSVSSKLEHTETKKEAVKEQKAVKQVNTSKIENSSKGIDKKPFNPFELLWLIIPLLIIYWVYREYKNLPFVPKF